MLIKQQVNLAAEDPDGYDGLKLAAQAGYSEIVRELLDKMVDSLKPLRSGDTAIHLAAEFGHPLTVGILLKKSPNGVYYMNNRKYSSLHLAAARAT